MCDSRFKATTPIPELLQAQPQLRGVFDRYGMKGCGGPNGPAESIGFFARAHDVPIDDLLAELEAASLSPSPPPRSPDNPSDAIYRRFFLAGIAVVLTLGAVWGALLLARIAWNGSFRAASLHEINAHGHAQIFGWVGLFVMGFAYQAFPRFKHTQLQWPTIAFLSFWLMLGGIIGRSILEPLAADNRALLSPVIFAAWVEVIAIMMMIAVMARTWATAVKPLVYYDAYIIAALGWFFIQAVCEMLYLAASLTTAGNAKLQLVATWQAPLRDIQIHGFAMLMTLGVTQRLVHDVFGMKEPNKRFSLIALPILNLAIVGEAVALVLMRQRGYGWASLWYGSVLVLGATVTALVIQWRILCKPPEPDRCSKFVRAAYGWLLLSLAMLALLPIYQFGVLPALAPDSAAAATGFSHAFYGATRHAITVGFLSLMIVGVAAKVVPTLAGLEGAALPKLWLPFILINLGCTMRVVGQIATDFTPNAFWIAGPSGVLEVAGLTLWGAHLARIMLGWYRVKDFVPVQELRADQPITPDNLVGDVLNMHPRVLPVFIAFGFRPLASPSLRKRLGGRVTIRRACRMVGVNELEFIDVLNSRLQLLAASLPVVEPRKHHTTGCSCCEERRMS